MSAPLYATKLQHREDIGRSDRLVLNGKVAELIRVHAVGHARIESAQPAVRGAGEGALLSRPSSRGAGAFDDAARTVVIPQPRAHGFAGSPAAP